MGFRNVLCVLLVVASACGDGDGASEEGSDESEGEGEILFYRSPMDPSFVSQSPGKDAMGMDLVAVREGDPGADLDSLQIDGATVQRLGVRTHVLTKQPLDRVIRAVGRVEFDETRVTTVNMKFDGWIERLNVNETGQYVRAGQPLFSIYSPELVASQEEYLQIVRGTAAGPHSAHLVRAARQRLALFDVPPSFISRIERTGRAQRRITIPAPRGGYVIHKTAYEGTFVRMGTNLFTLGELDALWIVADVYEFDAPWVGPGQEATIELTYLPGQLQTARVDYIYPTLDERTRTIQVRLVIPNAEVALRPGMFATVRIHAQPVGETLVVPSEAVIHSGERNVVFVALGEGRFEPRDVRLGVWGTQGYQVLDGLEEGERVVTSGQFLLDSESRLRQVALDMLGAESPIESDMDAMEMDDTDGESTDGEGTDGTDAHDMDDMNDMEDMEDMGETGMRTASMQAGMRPGMRDEGAANARPNH